MIQNRLRDSSNRRGGLRDRSKTGTRVATPDAETAAVVGWQIGNLHFPVQIVDGFILVMADPMVQTLLVREGWNHEEVSLVFHPLKLPPEAMIPPLNT